MKNYSNLLKSIKSFSLKNILSAYFISVLSVLLFLSLKFDFIIFLALDKPEGYYVFFVLAGLAISCIIVIIPYKTAFLNKSDIIFICFLCLLTAYQYIFLHEIKQGYKLVFFCCLPLLYCCFKLLLVTQIVKPKYFFTFFYVPVFVLLIIGFGNFVSNMSNIIAYGFNNANLAPVFFTAAFLCLTIRRWEVNIKWLLLFTTFLCILSIINESMIGLLLTYLLVCCLILAKWRIRIIYLLIGLILLFGIFFIINSDSLAGRLLITKICILNFKKYAFNGIGIGNFIYTFPSWQYDYFSSDSRSMKEILLADYPFAAYNDLLQLIIEIGLLPALLLIYLLIKLYFFKMFKKDVPNNFNYVLILLFLCNVPLN